MEMLFTALLLVVTSSIAIACGRFLYEVKYPRPGTRPSYWRVLLVAPVSLLFVVTAIPSAMGVFGLLGAL